MTQRDKYIEEMAKTNFVTGITTDIVNNEISAQALMKVLVDNKIIKYEDYLKALKHFTEKFVSIHTVDYDELAERGYMCFIPDDE